MTKNSLMDDANFDELRRLFGKDFESMRNEIVHFQQTGIPRCSLCKTDFIHAKDSITGKVSKYLWKPVCSCYGKNHVLSVW